MSTTSIIKRCILRSKYILYARSALQSKKEMDFVLNRMPTSALTAKSSVDELASQIDIQIDGWKRDMANALRPLFHKSNIEMGDKYWFSSNQLREGYVVLSTKPMEAYNVDDRVLLLSDVTDNKQTIAAGSIITWQTFLTISNLINGVIDSSFVVHYSLRKSKGNEKTN